MAEGLKEPINELEIRCVGLARSGNHAILNWIMRQIRGSYLFLNCAEPKFNPFTSARPLNDQGLTYQTNIDSFSLRSEQAGKLSRKDFLIYSYEDCFLGPLHNREFQRNKARFIGPSSEFKNILILRDPFNLFASRIKAGFIRGYHSNGPKPITILTLRRIYKQHAREFLGRSKLLTPLLPISFNRWALEKDYRKGITENIGIPFSDEGFKSVHEVAGGSSFDGVSYSGSAHKMKVNDRWETYALDEEYWDLFDTEMVDLAQEIFGEIPPIEFYQKHIG